MLGLAPIQVNISYATARRLPARRRRRPVRSAYRNDRSVEAPWPRGRGASEPCWPIGRPLGGSRPRARAAFRAERRRRGRRPDGREWLARPRRPARRNLDGRARPLAAQATTRRTLLGRRRPDRWQPRPKHPRLHPASTSGLFQVAATGPGLRRGPGRAVVASASRSSRLPPCRRRQSRGSRRTTRTQWRAQRLRSPSSR